MDRTRLRPCQSFLDKEFSRMLQLSERQVLIQQRAKCRAINPTCHIPSELVIWVRCLDVCHCLQLVLQSLWQIGEHCAPSCNHYIGEQMGPQVQVACQHTFCNEIMDADHLVIAQHTSLCAQHSTLVTAQHSTLVAAHIMCRQHSTAQHRAARTIMHSTYHYAPTCGQ